MSLLAEFALACRCVLFAANESLLTQIKCTDHHRGVLMSYSLPGNEAPDAAEEFLPPHGVADVRSSLSTEWILRQ